MSSFPWIMMSLELCMNLSSAFLLIFAEDIAPPFSFALWANSLPGPELAVVLSNCFWNCGFYSPNYLY